MIGLDRRVTPPGRPTTAPSPAMTVSGMGSSLRDLASVADDKRSDRGLAAVLPDRQADGNLACRDPSQIRAVRQGNEGIAQRPRGQERRPELHAADRAIEIVSPRRS